MNKITYKEFEEVINELGYDVRLDSVDYVKVTNGNEATVAAVHKKQYKALSLDWISFTILTDNERDLLADACWRLASTPLADREEPKKYRYKVVPKYRHLFSPRDVYLNYRTINDNRVWISGLLQTDYWQTEFTAEECAELEKRYDLTILERVEVEDN